MEGSNTANSSKQAPQQQEQAEIVEQLAKSFAQRQAERALGRSEAELTPLPAPAKAPYTRDEISFNLEAYVKPEVPSKQGSMSQDEATAEPPANAPRPASPSTEAKPASSAYNAPHAGDGFDERIKKEQLERAWDVLRAKPEVKEAVSKLGELASELRSAREIAGKEGYVRFMTAFWEIQQRVRMLSEAIREADDLAQM
ncbi:hypothetical protein JCM10908_000748 [Rhodotorula pacifica]|uniref:uncharacterized protein n=1 Tax=Rhodotorula pacifica TaxID=1495444 RepID=UPI003179E31D